MITALFLLISVMAILFLTEVIPIDLTALLGLSVLLALGYVHPEEAFRGFSSPTIITLVAMFFIAGALQRTGVTDEIAKFLQRFVGTGEKKAILSIMLLGSGLSAFMSNVAATAVLLPAAVRLSTRARIPASKILMPLSIATILGGMTTRIGTTPNMIVAEFLESKNGTFFTFQFEDFIPIGVASCVFGLVYLLGVGRHLLPSRSLKRSLDDPSRDLTKLYRLSERLFTLQIPPSSRLAGKSLAEADFTTTFGVQVIGLIRNGARTLNPDASEILKANDTLIAQGRRTRLESLLRFQGVKVVRLKDIENPLQSCTLESCTVEVLPGALTGETLTSLRFRELFGAIALSIERNGTLLSEAPHKEPLVAGDQLTLIGDTSFVDSLQREPSLRLLKRDLSCEWADDDRVFALQIPPHSPLAGVTIRDSKLGSHLGLRALGTLQNGKLHFSQQGEEVISEQDILLIAGKPELIQRLSALGELELKHLPENTSLESSEVGIHEVILSPRSESIGKTLIEMNFREKYGFQVLAIWREGRPLRTNLATERLRLGDSLLIHGPRSKLHLLSEENDFVLLSATAGTGPNRTKAWVAVLGLVTMILLALFRLASIQVAAFYGACIVVIGGALRMEEGYREVNWRVIMLIAALLPMGVAVERSGTASLLATALIDHVESFGPLGVLGSFLILSSVLSQILDSAISAALLAPIAYRVAEQLGLQPEPLLMAVALSASNAFLTPFSHKAHLIVMGPGGYRPKHYFRVGIPLTVGIFVICMVMIPWLFPF